MERMKTSVIYRNLQALADKSEEGRKLLTLYEVLVGIEDPLWVENRWEETQEGWTWKVYVGIEDPLWVDARGMHHDISKMAPEHVTSALGAIAAKVSARAPASASATRSEWIKELRDRPAIVRLVQRELDRAGANTIKHWDFGFERLKKEMLLEVEAFAFADSEEYKESYRLSRALGWEGVHTVLLAHLEETPYLTPDIILRLRETSWIDAVRQQPDLLALAVTVPDRPNTWPPSWPFGAEAFENTMLTMRSDLRTTNMTARERLPFDPHKEWKGVEVLAAFEVKYGDRTDERDLGKTNMPDEKKSLYEKLTEMHQKQQEKARIAPYKKLRETIYNSVKEELEMATTDNDSETTEAAEQRESAVTKTKDMLKRAVTTGGPAGVANSVTREVIRQLEENPMYPEVLKTEGGRRGMEMALPTIVHFMTSTEVGEDRLPGATVLQSWSEHAATGAATRGAGDLSEMILPFMGLLAGMVTEAFKKKGYKVDATTGEIKSIAAGEKDIGDMSLEEIEAYLEKKKAEALAEANES